MAILNDDVTKAPAIDIAAAIVQREVSAADVTAAFLERIEQLNPTINAICTLNKQALAEARTCDQRLSTGEAARPLEGVPIVVKDNVHTNGLRTTFGSRVMEDFVPDQDSICVERLKAAGAVLLGKTNTPEFAHDINTSNHVFGTTRNPWDLNRTAGGSSGGTGAALAADFAALGIGTDLGGSIRLPSSLCGITGIRPVPGRVPFYPTDFAWDTLVQHVQGPMARTVADVGLMLSVLAGPDDRDPTSLPAATQDFAAAARGVPDMTGRRVALSIDLNGIVPVDPEVADLVKAAARRLEALGCPVEEDCFDTTDVGEIIACTRGFGMVARYADHLAERAELLTDVLKAQVEAATELTVKRVTEAEAARTRYWHRVRTFLQRYDYIVTPTVGVPAFRMDKPLPTKIGGKKVARFHDAILTTYAFSITGLPVMSVPCGFTSGGLPVGMQIIGPRLREDRVLELAAAYSAACPEHFAKPEIDITTAKDLGDALKMPGLAMSR